MRLFQFQFIESIFWVLHAWWKLPQWAKFNTIVTETTDGFLLCEALTGPGARHAFYQVYDMLAVCYVITGLFNTCTSAAELLEVDCTVSLQGSDYGLFHCFSTSMLQSELNRVTTFWIHVCLTHLTVVQKCSDISKNIFSPILTSHWPVVLFLCSVVAASSCFISFDICYMLCFFRLVIFKLNILSVTVVILFLVAEMLVMFHFSLNCNRYLKAVYLW